MEENTIRQTEEIEINLWEICLVLVHNLALIISAGIMAALGVFLFTQLVITPSYESTTKIYILNNFKFFIRWCRILLNLNILREYLVLFIIGGITYVLIEISYRGYSHISMFIVGGFCFI